MKYYFAPMEGITGYRYRRLFSRYFTGVDKYFTPFIQPRIARSFNSRERKDILPENNEGICLVPQILTNKAEDFIRTAKELADYGYQEVNLNLGCPSKTVVTKGRGAGFLADLKGLDDFFCRVFEQLTMKISVKTRVGMEDPKEFGSLMELYNRHPIYELIIHPRFQSDYYKNCADWDLYAKGEQKSVHPLCYNGDLFTCADYERWEARFRKAPAAVCEDPKPESGSGMYTLASASGKPICEDRKEGTAAVMLGRGLIANPGLAARIRYGTKLEKDRLKEFHDELLASYEAQGAGERSALFKMKELWHYMICLFMDHKKQEKRIRKAQDFASYREAVRLLFAQCEFCEEAGYQGHEGSF